MIKHRPVKTAIFCLAIVTLLGSVNTCKIASGQDLVEQIERNGPSLELFKAQAIDTAVETWKWKVRLSERQQELIAKEQADGKGNLVKRQPRQHSFARLWATQESTTRYSLKRSNRWTPKSTT